MLNLCGTDGAPKVLPGHPGAGAGAGADGESAPWFHGGAEAGGGPAGGPVAEPRPKGPWVKA